jgi:peptide/nickel transport system substrate-binding protein
VLSALLPLCAALLSAPLRAEPPVKNPDTYVYLSLSDANSLDPAWAYDTVSNLIVDNVYENLLQFSGASAEKLEPLLATAVPTRENGLISADGRTIRLPIRQGVRFHDGSTMTAEDVRYSILRFLLQDRASGPSSILLEPLLGRASTRDDAGVPQKSAYADAARAVRLDGQTVVLTMPRPYAPLPSILASWVQVVSKKWAIEHGDWDGTEATWARFNDPRKESSPFFEAEMGTGPFRLERWDRRAQEIVLARHDGYWRTPARLKRAVVKSIPEFATRKLMLEAGDADSISADRSQLSLLRGLPGVELIDGLSTIALDPIVFFSFRVNPVANPFIGSGKLDGAGIPPDFFADKDVRLGVAYALDYAGFLRDVNQGRGTQATGCIPKTLPGYSPDQETFRFDPARAKERFQKAFGGRVWERGFRFTITYRGGRAAHQILAQMLKRGLESLNPKFQVDVRGLDWPAMIDASNAGKLPLPIMVWSVDYPDPHDFAYPLMDSKGDFPAVQKYSNPEADRLVEAALRETSMPRREELYRRLIRLEHEDVPHLVVIDGVRFRVQRDWLRGWIHSPLSPDSPYGGYFYPLYKQAKGS